MGERYRTIGLVRGRVIFVVYTWRLYKPGNKATACLPDPVARTLLRVIERNPQAVKKALAVA